MTTLAPLLVRLIVAAAAAAVLYSLASSVLDRLQVLVVAR